MEQGKSLTFLSAHRCPEVDLLPQENSVTSCSQITAQRSLTCTGELIDSHLDAPPTCHSENQEEEEDGTISDWSEEDLSLHFSPSVILQSDDDAQSDPESGFECIDVTMETLSGKGPKMVPKRQIHLKRKKDDKSSNLAQVKLEDSLLGGGGASVQVRHGPDLLRRQQSLPASLQTTSGGRGVDGFQVNRAHGEGSSQGVGVEGTSRQRLQKSFSLDETKTKMATCIIQNILSRKMQVERNTCQSATNQKKPSGTPPVEQRGGRDRGGGQTGGGVSKGPIHVVRDMRKLVKDSGNLDFTDYNKPTSFKVKGQRESPPPTYQQAVEVKGHSQGSGYSTTCWGRVTSAAASLSQSERSRDKKRQTSHPITDLRHGSTDDVILCVNPPHSPTCAPVGLSQSEKSRGRSHQTEAPLTSSVPLPCGPPSTLLQPQGPQPPPPTLEQSSTLGLSSPFYPPQQILQPCFYPASVLPFYPQILPPPVGSYVNRTLSFIQTPQTLRRLQESNLPVNTSDCPERLGPGERSCSSEVQVGDGGGSATPTEHEQWRQDQQQQFQQQQRHLCILQGLIPAQVGNDPIVDITGSAAACRTILHGSAPCQLMFDPRSGRCFYIDAPKTPQRKMLLDPETGQFVCVLLPAASSSPNCSLLNAMMTNPNAMMTNPNAMITNPNAMMTNPNAMMTNPNAMITNPNAMITNPNAMITNPNAMMTNAAYPLYNPTSSLMSIMKVQPTVSSLCPCPPPPIPQRSPSARTTHATPQ